MVVGEKIEPLFGASESDIEQSGLVGGFEVAIVAKNGEEATVGVGRKKEIAVKFEQDDDVGFEAFGFVDGEKMNLGANGVARENVFAAEDTRKGVLEVD